MLLLIKQHEYAAYLHSHPKVKHEDVKCKRITNTALIDTKFGRKVAYIFMHRTKSIIIYRNESNIQFL